MGEAALSDHPSSVAAIRRLVDGHRPAGRREVAARDRFLAELERLDHPCDPDADPVHVTASAVVVGERGTVLHLHRRLHRWLQPGGHVDPGEVPAAAALREAEEETGLRLRHPTEGPRFFHLDVHPAALGHTHLDLRYLLIGPPEDPAPPPGESPDARWFTWEQAEVVADEGLVEALPLAQVFWREMAEEEPS